MPLTPLCPTISSLSAILFLTLSAAARAGVDSVVTFNEIHYHPAPGQMTGEWIELKNQNSVDVDLSGWRLDGGVDFEFPAGTVVPAGRYVIIAADPEAFSEATGRTGVFGPFRNTLDNAGDSVALKNNNGRRMDEVQYNDKHPWPVAADGSGATLAKVEELFDSGTPENWQHSPGLGGTPGVYNFAPQSNNGTIPLDGVLRSADRWYPLDGTTADSTAKNADGTLFNAPTYSDVVPPIIGSGQSIDFNGTNQYVNILDAVHPIAYTIAAWVRPDTIRAQSIVIRSNASGPTSLSTHQIRMNSAGNFEHQTIAGTSRLVTGTTTAMAGQWYHVAVTAQNDGTMRLFVNGTEESAPLTVATLSTSGTRWMVGSNSSGGLAFFDGLIDDVGIWHGAMDASQVGHLATRFTLPSDVPVKNHALGRKVIAGSGAYPNLPFNGGVAPDDFAASNVTDGSASDVVGSSYWLGRDGVTTEQFIIDLGAAIDITQVLLRNTHHHQFNDRGTAGFRLSVASAVDAGNQLVDPVAVLTGTLTNRTMPAPLPPESVIPADAFTAANGLTPTRARYLKFESLTSTYSGNVGLNELEVLGTPVAGEVALRPVLIPLVINEITDDDAVTFWIELYNHGSEPLDLTGFVLETSEGASHTLPMTSLAAGGFLLLDESSTGLHPLDEEKVFLYSAGKKSVLDAVVVKAEHHRLRRPPLPGTAAPGEFLNAEAESDRTPGAANHISLPSSIVINEIMYHRRPQYLPFVENDEEWIELHNNSSAPVALGGWELDEAVSFIFPSGTTIPAGGYLCVSNNGAAFGVAHPGVTVIGDFSGGLSNRGERLILRDALKNPVDVVHYRDKEPWPIYTDGLGSSLELRNPDADNSVPESWADSDETTRSQWKNYTFTATARTPIYSPTITNTGTTAFHELRLGLLEEGEALVDDVSVREITTAPTVELIQNGTFDSPLKPVWRVLGNHGGSSVVDDAGNPVLQVRTTGPLFYMHNLLETTFKAGTAVVPVVNNREYTLSLRAKWLRGCPWLHTEIYYNKVTKAILLDQPAESGTPGARNSTYVTNFGPTFTRTRHDPVVPRASTPITVSTRAADPQGVGAVELKYSVNGGAFASTPMAAAPGGGFAGTIPGQNANAIIQFYVEAVDTAAIPAAATWPPAGPASRALIKVNDNRAVANKQNLRVITTTADATALANPVETMNNQRRGCTIIHNERDIFYNSKVRLRGSMFSRGNLATTGESLTFPADALFRGTQRTVSVRRGGMSEIIVKHAINRASGLPDNYNDIINLIGFRSDIFGAARMEMERFSNSWLDEFYPDGSEGTMFKLEGIRVPTQTFANGTKPAGNPEGIKNLTTSGIGWVVQLDLADLGPDGSQYRHATRWLNNFSRNDNARFVEMCRTLSLPVATSEQGLAFEQAIEPLMDVDEWMRCLAMMSLFGIDDAYARPGAPPSNPHNLNFYMPPTPDGKIAAIPWDWNFVFSIANNSPLTGDKNIQKVIARPRFKRLFLGHLKDIIDTTFNTAYMNPWLAHYGAVTGESYSSYTGNITGRRSSVLSQINAQIPPVAFTITSNNGTDFSVDRPTAIVEGDGWVDVREIRVNGSPGSLPVTWIDNNSWRVEVPLASGAQAVSLAAFDARGQPLGTDTITITSTSITQPASAENTVISEVHYRPMAAGELEFFEVMNISTSDPIDLTGCGFSAGLDFDFAPGTILAPGARLVVRASQFLNDTALSNNGERLRLVAPGDVVIKEFVYDDEPDWPSGPPTRGQSLVLIAPWENPDHSNPFNWRASSAIGGNASTSDTTPPTGDLVTYALGPNPQTTFSTRPEGLCFTVPWNSTADHAEVTGQVSSSLDSWESAALIDASPTTLTFLVPASVFDQAQVFTRMRVRSR